MITQDYLKQRYEYDPDTGLLTNRYTLSPKAVKGDIAGCTENNGYRTLRVLGKQYPMHRLIWLYVHGKLPDNTIDHINRIRDDNRLANLRDVNMCVNSHNKLPGKVGCKQAKSGRWIAVIKIDKKQVYLGTYDTPEEAHEIYLKRKQELLCYTTLSYS
jgi:hypothetical protein